MLAMKISRVEGNSVATVRLFSSVTIVYCSTLCVHACKGGQCHYTANIIHTVSEEIYVKAS